MAFGLFLLFLTLFATYYIYDYPSSRAKTTIMKMSSDTVLAILYMIIYMKSSPQLEGAIKFAAENLSGPLSYDLKKLLWDIEVGKYPTADSAIATYIEKWETRNQEFAESLNLLRGTAIKQSQREKTFSETINLILRGSKERAKHYVSDLRMPVMLIHAMGVLLPVMGLVLFPIVVIFMSDVVKPIFLFLGYDIFLPIFLWFFIDYILKSQPPTFSQPDISLAKGVPPIGKFKVHDKFIPLLPILAVVTVIPILFILLQIYPCLFPSAETVKSCAATSQDTTNLSFLLTIIIALGIAVYCLLDSWQKIKIRNDIEEMENEFSVALFQLGNQISVGKPIENAIDNTIINLKGTKISSLFLIVSSNMKRFGYTFKEALFDAKIGAIWYYPSRLIRSIMSIIIESSKKGMENTSTAMVTISKYLKGIHSTKEDISEILGETLISMKFLAMFLAPLISGVTITMAIIIIQILTSLSGLFAGLPVGESGISSTQFMPLTLWGGMNGEMPITPAIFQLIVGIYMIEVIIILSIFVNKVEYGEDKIGLMSLIGKSLLIGIVIYLLSWVITYNMFGDPISELLAPTMLK